MCHNTRTVRSGGNFSMCGSKVLNSTISLNSKHLYPPSQPAGPSFPSCQVFGLRYQSSTDFTGTTRTVVLSLPLWESKKESC